MHCRSSVRQLVAFAAFCALLVSAFALPAPDPLPAAPNGWDVFQPPTDISASSSAPAIAEYTRTGGPDDTLVVTGENFGKGGEQVEFIVFGQSTGNNAKVVTAALRSLDNGKAVVTLPASLPSWSTYLLWPKRGSELGRPVAINRTETWWLGAPERISPGQTVSIYGRNLTHGGATGSSWVYLKKAGSAGVWASIVDANPYRVQFAVPTNLPKGTYEVWVNNGHGGTYGWSGPVSLSVTDAYAWKGSTFNVATYGARGDGQTDDTDAVMAAYSAALKERDSGSNPTVYFPAGTYLLRYGFGFEHDIRFLGDGMDRSILKCHANFKQVRAAGDGLKLGLFFGNGGGQHDIEINGLTLDANDNMDPTSNSESVMYCSWGLSQNFRLSGVRIKTLVPGVTCAFLNNIAGLVITNCEFIGGRVFLFNGTQHAVNASSFYGANDSDTALAIRGTSNVSVVNCAARDWNNATTDGQGIGRFFIGNGDYGSLSNVYVANNSTTDLGPRPAATEQNGGEQILSEGNLVQFEGKPSAATTNTVTLPGVSQASVGQLVAVSAGRGLGQYRRIVGFDAGSHVVSVDSPWNVPPDSSSSVQILNGSNRWVIYRNTLDGKNDYAQRTTAMTGVEPFGGCFDWVVEGNTVSNVYAGFCSSALEQSSPVAAIGPCYFNLFQGNSISNSYEAIDNRCGIPARSADAGLGFLGNVFRRNTIRDVVTTGIREWTNAPATPGAPFDTNVYEHNSFQNLQRGYDGDFATAGARVKNSVLYQNTFDRGSVDPKGSIGAKFNANTAAASIVANTWSNFEATFAGPNLGLSASSDNGPANLPASPRMQSIVQADAR